MKRVAALLMCMLMIFSSVPMSPVAEYFNLAVQAYALEQELSRVEISPSSLTVYENRTGTLTATAYDSQGAKIESGITYTWTSDNDSVATVNGEGIVTGKSSEISGGLAIITVTARDASGNTASTYRAIMVKPFVPITSLKPASSTSIELTALETAEHKVTVAPFTASEPNLKWTSSDTDIVEIYQTGFDADTSTAYARISAKAEGTVTIKYMSDDGTGKWGEFTVKVNPLVSKLTLPNSLVLTMNSKNVRVIPTIEPENAGNKVLEWSSDAESVCKVSTQGYLTPQATGVCFISARTTDGSNHVKKTKVIVSDGTTNVTLDKSDFSMKVGDPSVKLTATCVTPTLEYKDAVLWTSSDPTVVQVSSAGSVTAVGPGTATVTATAIDNQAVSAQCTVSVTQPVTGVKLPDAAVCWLGETITLKAEIIPSNASNKNITWSVDDDSVAEISQQGVITGKATGVAVVTVETQDGSFRDTCSVSVEIPPESVTVSPSSITLKVGDSSIGSRTLTATVNPAEATNRIVNWTSSNPDVAKVDASGKVTAVAGGRAVITATTQSAGKTASCSVTVLEDETGVSITNETTSIYVSQQYTLGATIIPSTATNKEVTWTSSDPGVLRVDTATGTLVGISAGVAVITVTTAKGYTDTCTVTVTDKIPVTSITLDRNSATMLNGTSISLSATIKPDIASDKNVRWTSSNSSVAAVSPTGTVYAYKAGTTIIKATTVDGNLEAVCYITVTEPVTGIKVNPTSSTIPVGNAVAITAAVSPSNASNKKVNWMSSNTAVATVNSSGVVTAKSAGTTVITATTADGGFTAQSTVTVVVPVTGVKFNATSLIVPKGETRTVTTTITPSNATNKGLIWKSSDTTIATVSSTGLINGIRTGIVEISVTTKDGSHVAALDVTVIQPASSVSLSFTSISMDVGKRKTLTPTVKPLTVTDKTVKWKSSNTAVATVSDKGEIKGVSAGTATITCTSGDGYASATCKVTITQPPTAIKFSSSTATAKIGTPLTLSPVLSPSTVTNKNLVWSSSDSKIATVSNGVVTGIKKGTVKITARTSNNLSAVITVKVTQPVTGLSLNKTSLTIAVGKSTTIKANIKPSTASNKAVTWSSSNNDVLTVSSTGKVTAKTQGYAEVTCITKDGNKKATCSIFVRKPVKSLKLNKTSARLDVNEKLTLKATVKPSDASNPSLKWKSDDTRVAKVSSNGVVTPGTPGIAIITCTTIDGGYKATCKIVVARKVKSVSLPEELTVYLGEKKKISASIKPSNASDKKVSWKSSKKKIATISSKGTISPKKTGSTVITVTTHDGKKKDTCKVTVRRVIKSLKLKTKKVTLTAGNTYKLKVTKKPSNATELIKWTSADTKIAKVSSSGVITATGRGTVKITGKTDHGKKVVCTVTVNQPVTGMNISSKTADAYLGGTITLKANVLPTNANNKAFTWSSSDTSVATVSNGTVTPKKLGKVTISAKSANGKVASCVVTVKQHVNSVTLNKYSLTLNVGNTSALTATVNPSTASEKGYTFSSSNTAVAAVSADGIVTAKKAGTANITVKSKENNKSAVCKVTVLQPAESVKLSKASAEVYAGSKLTLTGTVSPSDTSNKKLTWTSSDTNIATVSGGVLTGKKAGTVTITAKTHNGKTASCTLTVKQHVTSITLDKTSVDIIKGETYTLAVTVNPSDATEKGYVFSTSDTSVATVNSEGVITAHKAGTATITVRSKENNKTATCTVNAIEKVESITVSPTTGHLYVGEQLNILCTVLPETATDKSVIWSSSEEEVASVDENGVITALKSGVADITATTVDGGLTASVTVVIQQKATSITLEDAITINRGSTKQINAVVLPSDAYNKNVTWDIIHPEIATIDQYGVVEGISTGTTVITATSVDGGFTASCVVTVNEPVTGVSLDKHDIERLYMGQTETLTATVYPTEYKGENMNRELIWTSDNEEILTVSDGVLTPVGKGNATVTVTTADGGFKDSCTVRCLIPVESIQTDKDIWYVYLGEQATIDAKAIPENADYPELKWEIAAGEGFFTLEEGVITTKAKGTGVVKITSVDNPQVTKTLEIHIVKKVEGISLNVNSMTLNKGDTYNLVSTVTPADAHDTTVKYTSDNESVATVDENGLVSAVGRGTAKITATTVDGSFSASCDFTVNQLVEEITFPEEEYTVGKGKRLTLSPTVLPEDATDKTLLWESSDNTKVTVNDGVVFGVEKGEAIITAKAADSGKAEKTVRITVVQHAESITLESDTTEIAVGDTAELTATVSPEDTTDKTVIWTSGDESVATVDENGVVTAVAADSQTGISTVTIKATSACKCAEGTYEFTVKQKVTDITVEEELLMEKGKLHTVEYEILPSNAYDKTLIWSSEDEDVATVKDGVIEALSTGETEITVTAADTGKVVKTISLTVVQYAEEIEIKGDTQELRVGGTTTLTAAVSPEDTTDKTVTWTSSNEEIAVVDENGKVIAVGTDAETGISTVTITATSACKKASATYDITVKQQATIINFAEESPVVELGDTYRISAEVLPVNTYDKTLIWTSDNEGVAAVDSDGILTAKGIGTAVIRAASVNGTVENEFTVKVIVLPQRVTMEEEIRLEKNASYQLNAVLTPDNVTETKITWSSSDESVASVCEMGLVTAHKTGEVTITAKTEKEDVFAECKVTVFVNSESITLDKNEHTFFVGEEITLTAQVLPEDTSDKTVTWSSDNEDVATVDSDGKVKAVNAGTAVIKVVTNDTGIEASCTVNVRKHTEAIYFDNDEMSAYIGRKIKFNVSFEPSDATERELIWTVSDERIATVDGEGNLNPLTEGSVILIAESKDCGYKAVCFIDVKTGTEKVKLNKESLLMDQLSSETLTFTLEPENVTDKKVIWSSSDESVATVRNGVVTSKAKAGQTVIRATSVDNSEAYAECTVTVKQHLQAIYLEESAFSLRKGDTAELSVIFDPVDATDKRVTFESSDDTVAQVDGNGKITAVGAGDAVITVTSAEGGYKAECNVKVYREIEEISGTDFTMRCLESEPANIIVTPSVNDEKLICTSTNENIAKMDDNGNIVAGSEPGEATITVTGSISGKSCSFKVTVIQPVSSIRFTRDSVEVSVGEYTAVPFEILPANASNKNVRFVSSDETVVIIDNQQDGTIYPIKAGNATITVITEDGELRASYNVTVTD